MTAIEIKEGTLTHINVFTVPPAQQQALIASLIETVNEAKAVPGWLSASIHRSVDGTQVINYVHFDNAEAAQAVLKHLASSGHLQRNTSLGRVTPGQYEVVYTLNTD